MTRNINMPSLLEMYSNLLELIRLRNELILCASECVVLQNVY